jgi:hypothetical protein
MVIKSSFQRKLKVWDMPYCLSISLCLCLNNPTRLLIVFKVLNKQNRHLCFHL